jgi:uncharacterized integral membrane protein
MTKPDATAARASEPRPPRKAGEHRERTRLVAAAVIGAILAAFALLNLNDVRVHWLIAAGQTPLIVVIVLAFLLGIAVDRLLLVRAKRKRRAAEPTSAP